MMYNISPDPTERIEIFLLSLALLVLLAVYAFFWVRVRLHLPIFQRVPLRTVMAMEDPVYYLYRQNMKQKEAEAQAQAEVQTN